MFEFKLPDLGEGVHEGEILHWYVNQGDTINEDDPLVEIETDKAAVTIPSPKGGKVISVAGAVGETVAVGAVMVVIDDSGVAATGDGPGPSAPASVDAEPAPATAPAPKLEAVPTTVLTPPPSSSEGPVPAAPATRRLARELGVDLRQVPPSGPAGRVTGDDVRRFAAGGAIVPKPGAPAPGATTGAAVASPADRPAPGVAAPRPLAPAGVLPTDGSAIPFFKLEPLPDFARWGEVEREAMRSIRRKVAYRMTTAMAVVPHVVHMDEADVTELDAFRRQQRDRLEGQPGGRLTVLAFAIKAAAALLKARPKFNASIDPFAEEVVYKRFVNVGFAADTDRGLVVPVVPDADRKTLLELSAAIEDLATRAREGRLEVSELQGGTFTITNVGSLGGTNVIPTINYPEVAILGMGRAQPKPVVRDGEVVVRTMLPLTLAFDHRIIDGADAARFMSALCRYLSDPKILLVEC